MKANLLALEQLARQQTELARLEAAADSRLAELNLALWLARQPAKLFTFSLQLPSFDRLLCELSHTAPAPIPATWSLALILPHHSLLQALGSPLPARQARLFSFNLPLPITLPATVRLCLVVVGSQTQPQAQAQAQAQAPGQPNPNPNPNPNPSPLSIEQTPHVVPIGTQTLDLLSSSLPLAEPNPTQPPSHLAAPPSLLVLGAPAAHLSPAQLLAQLNLTPALRLPNGATASLIASIRLHTLPGLDSLLQVRLPQLSLAATPPTYQPALRHALLTRLLAFSPNPPPPTPDQRALLSTGRKLARLRLANLVSAAARLEPQLSQLEDEFSRLAGQRAVLGQRLQPLLPHLIHLANCHNTATHLYSDLRSLAVNLLL